MSLLNCEGCVDYMGGSKSCVGRVGLKFYEGQNVHAQPSIKFLRFLQVFMYIGNKLYIKISIKSPRFISSINFENRLISYVSEDRFLSH